MSNSLTELIFYYQHYVKSTFGILIGTTFSTRKFQLGIESEFNEGYMFIHVNVKGHPPRHVLDGGIIDPLFNISNVFRLIICWSFMLYTPWILGISPSKYGIKSKLALKMLSDK